MPSSANPSTHLSPAELSYLHTSLSSHPPIRPDSRTNTDFRPLNAETGILPNTMGSAHVGFADGREAVVGVRAEVQKTTTRLRVGQRRDGEDDDVEMVDSEGQTKGHKQRGKADWVTLGLTLPGLRDDDKDLVFLEEMLRESLVTPLTSSSMSVGVETNGVAQSSSLQDALVINYRWHWHLYIDVLLISAPESSGGNYPLPLLSMAVHLALRDTRLPRLKSEGDEDPVADDDWEAAGYLYSRSMKKKGLLQAGLVPPVTLLVMVVAENVVFDPSATELAVADGVLAVSVGRVLASPTSATTDSEVDVDSNIKILAIRTLETPARDTMKGVPRDAMVDGGGVGLGLASATDQVVPGVWKPKVGGVKRGVLLKVVKSVAGGGVGREVLEGLDGFLGSV